LAEVEDAATVDAIIAHFAGTGGDLFHGGSLPADVLGLSMPGDVFQVGITTDPIDDASQAAAVAQA